MTKHPDYESMAERLEKRLPLPPEDERVYVQPGPTAEELAPAYVRRHLEGWPIGSLPPLAD